MSSGSKKENQIYYPFLSKSPGKRIPSRFPNGAPMERDTRLQDIFHISLDIFLYLKGSKKGASVHVPQERGPYENRRPFQSLNISFGVLSNGAFFPGSLHRASIERDAPPPEPLSAIRQSSWLASPLQVAHLSPHEESCPSTDGKAILIFLIYIFRTVQLRIILVGNQLDAQFLL